MAKAIQSVPSTASEIQNVNPGALTQAPSWVKMEGRGTEVIKNEDIQYPRIMVAQSGHPFLKKNDPAFIEDLRSGEMFNTLDHRVYGNGPVEFCVVKAAAPYFMVLRPKSEGGGIIERDVPADDPRTQFTTDKDGKSIKPVATKFYTYVLMLLSGQDVQPGELAVMTLKSTGLMTAKRLNGLIRARGKADIYAGKYKMTTSEMSNEKGTWGVFVVNNAGWIAEEFAKPAEDVFLAMQEKDVRVTDAEVEADQGAEKDREPGEDDDM